MLQARPRQINRILHPIAARGACQVFGFLILIVIVILIGMNRRFDHEKLEVYQESLAFIAWLEPLNSPSPSRSGTNWIGRAHRSR